MMSDIHSDPVLDRAFAAVASANETVPWMEQLYLPSELQFRPLSPDMLALLTGSDDFTMPEPGHPVQLNVFSEEGDAGMIVFVHPETGVLHALVPRTSGE